MLQQNSYFPSRYTRWLKDNLPFFDVVLFLISSLLFVFRLYIEQTLFIAAVLAFRIPMYLNIQKKSVKKLVFTARIKRLFAAAALIQIVLIFIYAVKSVTLAGRLCMVSSFTLSFLCPVMIYLIWAVTLPAEKAVNLWFISDAKKRLDSYKDLKVIGITGSYGKTSVKFILTRILSEKYNTVCTPHSFNTPMGVVRTIRENFKPQTQVFVCEMGAKKRGDIKEICRIVNPNAGIITSVGEQHLETFGTVDNVFRTKFELADAVEQNGGKVFVNGDSREISKRIEKGRFTLYGTDKSCDYVIDNINCDRNGSQFDLTGKDVSIHLTSKLLGFYNILNIAGAAAMALSFGVAANDIQFAVSTLKPTEHRLELKPGPKRSLIIDDAYNANPEGSLEAVNVLASFKDMKKVIITPGLIELGSREYDCNRDLGEKAARNCDVIILVGKNRSKPLEDGVKSTDFDIENLFIVSSFREAMEVYSRFADENTVVLWENDLPDNYLK